MQAYTLLENMVFFINKSSKKNTQFEQASRKPFYDFRQVDFNMSIVIGVVIFTSKIWTIWLVILIGQIFSHMKKNVVGS